MSGLQRGTARQAAELHWLRRGISEAEARAREDAAYARGVDHGERAGALWAAAFYVVMTVIVVLACAALGVRP